MDDISCANTPANRRYARPLRRTPFGKIHKKVSPIVSNLLFASIAHMFSKDSYSPVLSITLFTCLDGFYSHSVSIPPSASLSHLPSKCFCSHYVSIHLFESLAHMLSISLLQIVLRLHDLAEMSNQPSMSPASHATAALIAAGQRTKIMGFLFRMTRISLYAL
jgi:hypothetical protein